MTKPKTARLEPQDVELLREVLDKRAPSWTAAVLPKAISSQLDQYERGQLCELIGAEFAETGLGAEDEPLPRGLKLEELLDKINRPNLAP